MTTTEVQHGSVTIRMTDTDNGCELLIFDKFVRRWMFVPGVVAQQVNTEDIAAKFRRTSAAVSRRN